MKQMSLFEQVEDSADKLPIPQELARVYGFPLQRYETERGTLYAVQDWLAGVAQTDNPRDYWLKMKKRAVDKKLITKNQLVKMPYLASNGKTYQMDFTNEEVLYYITNLMKPAERRNKVLGLPAPNVVQSGFVYIIHVEGIPNYKIGRAENFERRLGSYRLATPPSLVWITDYVSWVDNFHSIEKTLHINLSKYSLRGEWYDFPSNVLRDIIQWLEQRRLGIDIATGQPLLTEGN